MMNTKKSTVACALNMVQLLRWMAQQQQQGFCSTQVAVRMNRHVRTAQRTLTQLLDEGMVRFSDAERDRRWYPQPVLCELFSGGLSSGADAGDDPGHVSMSDWHLPCDKCGADTGDDPWHVSMSGLRHVHLCDQCYVPNDYDAAVLRAQRDQLHRAGTDIIAAAASAALTEHSHATKLLSQIERLQALVVDIDAGANHGGA